MLASWPGCLSAWGPGSTGAGPGTRPPPHPRRAGGLLQGAEGSEVRLRVQPAAGGAPRDLTLTRQRIEVNAVTQELCSSSGEHDDKMHLL